MTTPTTDPAAQDDARAPASPDDPPVSMLDALHRCEEAGRAARRSREEWLAMARNGIGEHFGRLLVKVAGKRAELIGFTEDGAQDPVVYWQGDLPVGARQFGSLPPPDRRTMAIVVPESAIDPWTSLDDDRLLMERKREQAIELLQKAEGQKLGAMIESVLLVANNMTGLRDACAHSGGGK